MNIFDQLLGSSATGSAALLDEGAVLSLGDLLRDAETLAEQMRSAGLGPREPVALWLPLGRELVAAMLAVRSVGAIYSVVGVRSTSFEVSGLLTQLGCRLIVTSTGLARRVEGFTPVKQDAWMGCVLVESGVDTTPPPFDKGDACVIFTSGSTAKPKGVVLTDSSLSHNAHGVADFTCLTPLDRSVVFTPPQFAFAQSQVLSHLAAGAPFLPWPSGVGPHDHLWRAMREVRATGLSANPSSFEMLVAAGQGLSLDSVRYVVSAGQPLHLPTTGKLRAAFPNARIASCFGCTENTLRATFFWLPRGDARLPAVLPVGRPIRGSSIEIVNEHGQSVEMNAVGRVRLSGRSLMRGYLDVLRGPDDSVPFFDTDDLGYIDSLGDLHLTGRVSARMNVGNEKVSPEEVEAVIAGVAGIEECAVGPLRDELLGEVPAAILVPINPAQHEEVASAARAACEGLLSRPKRPKHYFVVDRLALPRTEYGKLSRGRLPEILATLAKGVAP